MTVLSIIRDCLDSLLHPSARYDTLMRARHRAFMAPRLLGSLVVFAAFPIYLVVRGAPSALEVVALAWLIAPILLSWFLSHTGHYEGAHVLSSLALAGFVVALATVTGGIDSFAVIWFSIVPLEAALAASLRVAAFATVLTLTCLASLIALGHFDLLPAVYVFGSAREIFVAFGAGSAILYAAALALGARSLGRTSVALLSVEEDRYRLLARNMSDVISRHSGNGKVRFISPAAETMVGTPGSRLLGYGLFDRVHVTDRPAYLSALSDAARAHEPRSVEFRLKRDLQGSEQLPVRKSDFIWVEMRCRPLEQLTEAPGSTEMEVVAVMRDVTERKLQQQALDLAREAAEQADVSRTRFLATMSHELRTPLNAIIGFSEMIVQEDALMLDPSRRREYAHLINESGHHLLSIVNGILDVSKMEAGNFEISPESFAPRPALINCCNLLALKARDSGIELVTRLSGDLPAMTGDPLAFKQIVLNLVANAIKFTDRGGAVTVSACVEGPRLVLRVTDTGVGIAADDLKRVGDPFFQVDKTYQRRHEGTGLGLSIVKNLVSLHTGEMAVQSKVGEGTTVTVALPLMFEPPGLEPSSNLAILNPAARYSSNAQADQVKRSA